MMPATCVPWPNSSVFETGDGRPAQDHAVQAEACPEIGIGGDPGVDHGDRHARARRRDGLADAHVEVVQHRGDRIGRLRRTDRLGADRGGARRRGRLIVLSRTR